MTPQEKLAARLIALADAAEMTEDSDRMPGEDPTAECVFVDMRPGEFDSLIREAATLLSEHGEVVVTTDESGRCVAVTRQDGEGRILSVIWEASEQGGGGEATPPDANWCRTCGKHRNDPMAIFCRDGCHDKLRKTNTTPPTPSAPVVDDAMVERACEVLSEHALDGDGPSTHAMRLALTAALSGVSAPVGVEGSLVEVGEVKMVDFAERVGKYADVVWRGFGTPANHYPSGTKLYVLKTARRVERSGTDADSGNWIGETFKPLPQDEVEVLRSVGAPGFEASALTPAAAPRGDAFELCDECLRLDRLCDKHAHLPGTLESFIADQKPAASEEEEQRCPTCYDNPRVSQCSRCGRGAWT